MAKPIKSIKPLSGKQADAFAKAMMIKEGKAQAISEFKEIIDEQISNGKHIHTSSNYGKKKTCDGLRCPTEVLEELKAKIDKTAQEILG